MFSQNFERTLQRALTYAKERYSEFATLETMLLALIEDPDARPLLAAAGADLEQLRSELVAHLDAEQNRQAQTWKDEPKFTVGIERVLRRATSGRDGQTSPPATGRDVLTAMFADPDGPAMYYLERLGLSLAHSSNFVWQEDLSQEPLLPLRPKPEPKGTAVDQADDEGLEAFCINLNEQARSGKVDPLIGRAAEVERTVQVLSRRTKNNPLFVGDPGVGKTAIAEGLARRINADEVPKVLRGATIYSLDMGTLLAGTRFRGEFEERLKGVMKGLMEHPKAILFIDEIHTLIGAGATSDGAMDASNLLKPALQNGSLRCIGATTNKEFRNYFEKDSALVRRFQKIDVVEPSVEATVEILRGLKRYYEDYHGVRYGNEALTAAAELAARYINGRKLPDKAIDVIDEAGARHAVRDDDRRRKTVRVGDIEATVAQIARIPPKNVSKDDRATLRGLERTLRQKVFGQDAAIEELSSAIKLSRAGLRDPRKPIGCYLFAGPTGVGKTEITRQLAQSLGIGLVRFDMSEYMEKHSISRLIGAPPGYVGYDQGGLLTEAVDQQPHCVVLLDEIEKAHPELFNILLQVMDDGRLTDNNGKTCDFRNVILIMTTNAGSSDMAKPAIGFGRGRREDEDLEAINRLFAPEFRNRLDAVIRFTPLQPAIMLRIVDKFIAEMTEQLSQRKVTIEFSDEARDWLATEGYDEVYGARPLARVLQRHVKKPLADELLFGRLRTGGHVRVFAGDPLRFVCDRAPDKRKGARTVTAKSPAAVG